MTFLHSSITMAVFKILQRELYKKKNPQMWEYLLSLFHLLLKGERRFHCHLKYDIMLKYTLFKNTTQGLPSLQLSLQ